MQTSASTGRRLIWDLPTRVFHWALAGSFLGAYLLAGTGPRVDGRAVMAGVAVAVTTMLVVLFAARLARWPGLTWLAPVGRLAWPWYVPLGTTICVATGWAASHRPRGGARAAQGGQA